MEQMKTCTFPCYQGFMPLLFSTSFEIAPTCIIIFFMTQRNYILFFPKVLFSNKHLQEFFSFEENSV